MIDVSLICELPEGFAATRDRGLVGVGGLNIDPYACSPLIGRMRRRYVVPTAGLAPTEDGTKAAGT
jgi:hypothetical protein